MGLVQPDMLAQHFPRLKKHKLSADEKGGIMSTLVFRPINRWAQGPFGPKPAYGMFVMDNTKNIFIHGFPSFQIPYFSKG